MRIFISRTFQYKIVGVASNNAFPTQRMAAPIRAGVLQVFADIA